MVRAAYSEADSWRDAFRFYANKHPNTFTQGYYITYTFGIQYSVPKNTTTARANLPCGGQERHETEARSTVQ
jgi:hypothetical protein